MHGFNDGMSFPVPYMMGTHTEPPITEEMEEDKAGDEEEEAD